MTAYGNERRDGVTGLPLRLDAAHPRQERETSTISCRRGPVTSGLHADANPALQARRSTFVAFFAAGAIFATWVSRIPQVRLQVGLSAADLGLVLLAIAAGSLTALPVAGVVIHRFGTRFAVTVMSVVAAGSLSLVGIGYHYGVVPVVVGLFLLGFALAAWAVGMNVQGATVERRLGRAIMPRFHAGFSIGTVAGALLGAGMVALDVPVTAHFLIISSLAVCVIPVSVGAFLPDVDDSQSVPRDTLQPTSPRRWIERRTLLIGLVVFAFAFAEGTGNDWIGVALIDDHHAPAAVATLAYAAFLSAMTSGRLIGPMLLNRFGRIRTIRGLAVLAFAGLLLFVLSPWAPLAFAGTLLWGFGACLGFPVGLSAAADDPGAAAARVSVVSGIGQLAFLGGPPVIGFLGSISTIQHALGIVAVFIALATLIASSLEAPKHTRPTRQMSK